MTKIARTLSLLLLAPVLFGWHVIVTLIVVIGVTAQGIGKVWRAER